MYTLKRSAKGKYSFWLYDGNYWDVPTESYVMDDFGNLIEVN